MRAFLVLLAALAAGCVVYREPPPPREEQPREEPAPAARAHFRGWLLVTPDPEWKDKFRASADGMPELEEAETVRPGDRVYVLAFFSDPDPNRSGNVQVKCDFDVTSPDGQSAAHEENAICYRGPSDQRNVYVSSPLYFVGEREDPRGEWQVRIVLRDDASRAEAPLQTSFYVQ